MWSSFINCSAGWHVFDEDQADGSTAASHSTAIAANANQPPADNALSSSVLTPQFTASFDNNTCSSVPSDNNSGGDIENTVVAEKAIPISPSLSLLDKTFASSDESSQEDEEDEDVVGPFDVNAESIRRMKIFAKGCFIAILIGIILIIVSVGKPNQNNQSFLDIPVTLEQSLPPSITPSINPTTTNFPTLQPTSSPSAFPSTAPTLFPSTSRQPTSTPSRFPSTFPSANPTLSPSMSREPTSTPSLSPSESRVPTGGIESASPSAEGETLSPTLPPSQEPSQLPTAEPSNSPSPDPATETTSLPSPMPTAEPTNPPSPMPTPPPTPPPTDLPEPSKDTITKIFLIADTPYSDRERSTLMPNHIDQLEKGDFLVHLGDLMFAMKDRCREGAYSIAAEILQKAKMPTFVLPGDNDINDCPSIQHGEEMWMKYFHLFDKKHWSHSFDVTRWGKLNESFGFLHKRVLFFGLNMVGGTPYSWDEKSNRHREHLEQAKALFIEHEGKFDVIVLMKHAIPMYPHQDFFGDGSRDGLFINLINRQSICMEIITLVMKERQIMVWTTK